jgi:hypothetical protein
MILKEVRLSMVDFRSLTVDQNHAHRAFQSTIKHQQSMIAFRWSETPKIKPTHCAV